MPVKPSEIRLTGGISRSVAWRTAAVEGAAMGAALHALWVYQMEHGQKISLEDVVQPYIKLDETTRVKPNPKDVATYQTVIQEFSARRLVCAIIRPRPIRSGCVRGQSNT